MQMLLTNYTLMTTLSMLAWSAESTKDLSATADDAVRTRERQADLIPSAAAGPL